MTLSCIVLAPLFLLVVLENPHLLSDQVLPLVLELHLTQEGLENQVGQEALGSQCQRCIHSSLDNLLKT